MSVLLWAVEPILILLLAFVLLRERVPTAQASVMAVAVGGVLLVVFKDAATGDALGVTLTLAAVGACALYTIGARKLLVDDASLPVAMVQQAAALVFAVLLLAVVHVATGSAWTILSLSITVWLAAVASGLLYYGLAFLVLPERAAAGAGVGGRRLPPAHPGLRGSGGLPGG